MVTCNSQGNLLLQLYGIIYSAIGSDRQHLIKSPTKMKLKNGGILAQFKLIIILLLDIAIKLDLYCE